MASVYSTRDIYLAGYCQLSGCKIDIERSMGESRAVFKVNSPDEVDLKGTVQGYFDDVAQCSPKALKFAVMDLKNRLFPVVRDIQEKAASQKGGVQKNP